MQTIIEQYPNLPPELSAILERKRNKLERPRPQPTIEQRVAKVRHDLKQLVADCTSDKWEILGRDLMDMLDIADCWVEGEEYWTWRKSLWEQGEGVPGDKREWKA